MTPLSKEDIVKYIIKIKLNFENAYATSNDFERQLLAESWYEALCEYPKEICDLAVNNALKNAKFAPRLGDITENIESIINSTAKSDEELWTELAEILPRVYEISRYLSYEHYYAWANAKLTEIFNKLSNEVSTYIVNTSTLVEFSEMTDEALKFERARFLKQLPTLRKRCQQKNKTQLLQNIVNETKLLK